MRHRVTRSTTRRFLSLVRYSCGGASLESNASRKTTHSGRTAFITFMARLTDNGNRLPKLQHDGLVGLGDHKQYLGNQMNARTNATAPIC